MAEKTLIAWTDHTFNPVWGCQKVSPGCEHCYAECIAKVKYSKRRIWGPHSERRILSNKCWWEPLKWDAKAQADGVRRRVFCGSMCDVFEDHPTTAAEREPLFQLIRFTPHLDWLLLTKRADNIKACLPEDWGSGYSNVWLGVTVENDNYRHRADHLKRIPAAIHFVSYEPALGPLEMDLDGIDWLIYGGESGPKHRKDDITWARSIRQQCEAANTAFFFKQSANQYPGRGIELDGVVVRTFPQGQKA
jgi:protein gp37